MLDWIIYAIVAIVFFVSFKFSNKVSLWVLIVALIVIAILKLGF